MVWNIFQNYREWLHEIETIFKKEIIHHYHKESSHNVQQSKKDDKTVRFCAEWNFSMNLWATQPLLETVWENLISHS